MKKIKAFGEIKQGVFYPRNSAFYLQQIRDVGNVNECVLTIEGANKRTLDQNAFAWMMFGKIAYAMQQKGYEDVTPEMLYRQAEERYCGVTLENKNTGGYLEMTKPLKSQPTDIFSNIIETIRTGFNENDAFDIYIETPAQWYGLTEEAYDLWKSGAINKFEAKKMSEQ